MPTLTTQFRSRAALQRAMTARSGEAGIFVPGQYPGLALHGDLVRVHVRAEGLGAGAWLEGHARERCTLGGESGIWVAVPAVLSAPYFFLLNWSLGWSVESGRRGTRYPADLAAHVCVLSGPRTGVRVRATVRNTSSGGALVTTSLPLAAGQALRLEIEVDERTFAFPTTVAWSSRLYAGLRVVFDNPDRSRAWALVLCDARTRAGADLASDADSIAETEQLVDQTGEISLSALEPDAGGTGVTGRNRVA